MLSSHWREWIVKVNSSTHPWRETSHPPRLRCAVPMMTRLAGRLCILSVMREFLRRAAEVGEDSDDFCQHHIHSCRIGRGGKKHVQSWARSIRSHTLTCRLGRTGETSPHQIDIHFSRCLVHFSSCLLKLPDLIQL